jgi:hypothetical protein
MAAKAIDMYARTLKPVLPDRAAIAGTSPLFNLSPILTLISGQVFRGDLKIPAGRHKKS